MAKKDEKSALTVYSLLPEPLRNRIVLDYPLDVLLNRKCELTAYERGLYGRARTVVDAAKELIRHCDSERVEAQAREAQTRVETACRQPGLISDLHSEEDWDAPVREYVQAVDELPRDERRSLGSEIGGLVLPTSDPDGQTPGFEESTGVRHAVCLSDALPSETPSTGEDTWEQAVQAMVRERQPRECAASYSKRETFASIPSEGLAYLRRCSHTGTGNILIRGRPGTCKSTLALQCAVMCTVSPNYYSSIFVSLEESAEQVLDKCRIMQWDTQVLCLQELTELDEYSSSKDLASALRSALRKAQGVHADDDRASYAPLIEGRVILPMLSPRSIRASARASTDTFQVRYEQLERLLRGFRWLCNHPEEEGRGLPQVRMLCIDSLSALTDRSLTREELYRVFDLFSTYQVIGVVTAEDQSGEDSDTMEYLADVVVELHSEQDHGYAIKYLEIKKSRHQHQVYGWHPFTVRDPSDLHDPCDPRPLLGY